MTAARTVVETPGGLTAAEARALLAEVGANVLAEARGPSNARRFAANLVHLFALLLWVGAILAWLAGMPELSAAIVAVVIVNAVFAFVQEYRAERAVASLRELLPQTARVRRDGVRVEIPAAEVVPGDVLLVEAGDRVSADAELVLRAELRIDDSALTGESYPSVPEDEIFAGTFVVAGRGEAVVTATGMATRFGRIAALTQETEHERSPLERELDRVTRFVAVLSVGIGATFFLVAGALGMSLSDRFVFAIGVTIANVPEGLLPTVTFSLALATQRMAKRHALVRRLSSVETLGETTVICTDKTGTLTENEMTVQRIWTKDGFADVEGAGYAPFGRFLRDGLIVSPKTYAELLGIGLLCNDARLVQTGGGWFVLGDPTEGALVVLAEKGGLRHEQEAAHRPRVAEIPFDSRRKRMTTVHLVDGTEVAYVKGAVEALLPRSTLSAEEQAHVREAAAEMERDALRVLALARRTLLAGAPDGADALERDLEFLGLVGMLDPPRPEVPDAVRRCHRAGIRIIMVTGDSGGTAAAIAKRIGLVHGEPHVVSGEELTALSDDELRRRLRDHEVVFARIDPAEKLRLARILREDGEIVAMTGDGVNDAPALREADIGVAMGRRGTDVAREAADIVLLDDNFASVVATVEEGRGVYDNIRRFAAYHFCSNVGELIPFLVWGISGGAVPLPLVVMQVLAIDLGTDMLPAIALGTERAEAGTMDRPPRPRTERLLNGRTLARVYGYVGPLEGLAAMTSFLFAFTLAGWRPWEALPDSGSLYVQATAMTCAGIVMAQVGAGLAMRTNRQSLRSVGVLSNRLLLVGIAFEIGLVWALTLVPWLVEAFHMAPLGAWNWLFLLIWPPLVLGAEEARKAVVRRRAGSGKTPTKTRPVPDAPSLVPGEHGLEEGRAR
jgi:magnesium-transporting ATPase (P-type)